MVALIAAFAVIADAAAADAAGADAKATTHTIVIDGTAFVPSNLAVKRGDRVVWINKDPFPHTVTATDKSFDSGTIEAGKSWQLVLSRNGTLDYFCTLHPTMHGKLEVQ